MKIAICDDEVIIVNQIEHILTEYKRAKSKNLKIDKYCNAESLYQCLREHKYDLIYLDIELNKMSGVELGQKIREELNDYITKIVFISSKDGYERQMLDVQPLGFISKPLTADDIIKMMHRVEKSLSQLKKLKTFAYTKKKTIYQIPISDIIYFESLDHNIKIVTLTGNDEYYDTLKNVVSMLAEENFIHIHRSYYINYENIKRAYYDSVTMINNDNLMISRSKRQEVRNKVKELMQGVKL